MEIKDKIEIMQAFADGKEIEYKSMYSSSDNWVVDSNPDWNWAESEYRIRQTVKYPFFKKRKCQSLVILFTDKRCGYVNKKSTCSSYRVGSHSTT